ncbi:MAG: two-component regulator propeller domain-containing protein [Acidobacteriota bacterium]
MPSRALDPQRALTQYLRRSWTSDQGLPQNSVQAIAQTPDGFIWLATQEGLARFDGVDFEIFSAATDPAFSVNNVLSLLVSADGTLWAGTEGGGVVRRTPSGFQSLPLPENLRNRTVRSLAEAPVGTLWVGTSGGLLRVSGDRLEEVVPSERLQKAGVNAMAPDGRGGLWLGTYGRGVFRFREGAVEPAPFQERLPSPRIYALRSDDEGNLWLGTEGGGLCRWDGKDLHAFTAEEGLPSRMVYSLLRAPDGTLWVGTYGEGLFRYRNGRFENLSSRQGLSNDVVLSLLLDREGNLWVGTNGGGVNLLEDGRVLCLGTPEGLPENMVSTVLEDRKGTLWVGTYGAGLVRIERGRVAAVYDRKDGFPDDNVYALAEDGGGDLWVGTGAGLGLFRGGKWTFWRERDGLPVEMIYALLPEPGGALWIGTGGSCIARFHRGRFETYDRQKGLASRTVVCLGHDAQGRLLAGTYDGLCRWEGDHFSVLGREQGFAHSGIFSLLPDEDGTLWAGTYGGGLHRVQGGRAVPIRRKDGLFDDVVYTVLDDGRGRLWMSCNRGVFSVEKAEARAFAEGRAPGVSCLSLGKADGMRSPECNGGSQPAGWRLRDGRLCFPTTQGLVFVDPEALRPGPPPPVVLEGATYDGRPFPGSSPAPDLPPGKGNLEFRYAALRFAGLEKVRYAYRLEGFEQEWHDAGARRTAFYTNIPHGSYRFVVRAIGGDGAVDPRGASLAFRIQPHFYETKAFAALVVLLAVLAGFLFYAARVARLKARQRELERLVALRTDELAQALQKVESQAAELREFNTRLREKVREQFEQIVRDKRLTKYFPRKLVDKILLSEEDVSLATERRTVTTFFTDLRGFTRLSDTTDPERVTEILNAHLTEMAAAIEAHGGTLARFMGDGILGFFGAPDDMDPVLQARSACRMALHMQARMTALVERLGLPRGEEGLALRIGIHQDQVTVGNFGSPDHVEFTALGRGVNLAKRLEEACPPGSVLVTDTLAQKVLDRFDFGPPESRRFKGFLEEVVVRRLLGEKSPPPP